MTSFMLEAMQEATFIGFGTAFMTQPMKLVSEPSAAGVLEEEEDKSKSMRPGAFGISSPNSRSNPWKS
eukprot:CAMPEP_0177484170 /NCGR_PEP_ID=MMETSP0369-20130122/27874_1 /TAXON_ID=447022 ORGANISM="Scrippsiella hangoei-like, Strain SHHI-4" /NCGR_SAMPLE_ID=MMETSP0369 /ASSEMBLY_ACC=CAM_ASM_000364 /LENGTH=67 /DNA_ID=CAMNT_0018960243 /DNA_START=185 /DNA_END=385 /DNA_ORIENTATION=+